MYKSLSEASAYLGKSEKTISRYIKRGILHPDRVKSQNGTLEYRFLTEELDAIKDQTDQTEQTRQDKTSKDGFSSTDQTDKTRHQTDQTRHLSTDERAFLYNQIEQKDRLIQHLSIQNAQLHNKILGLPAPKRHEADISPAGRIDTRRIVLIACLVVAALLFVYVYRAQIAEILTYIKGVITR